MKASKVMLYKETPVLPKLAERKMPVLEVIKCDTYAAAELLVAKGLYPVVLDFASDTTPGGGYKSGRGRQIGTQEESLCHRSNLGKILESNADKYPIPDSGAIYIPTVTVALNTDLKPLAVPFNVAVIAASMRCIAGSSIDRIDRKIACVMAIAAAHGHDCVVLGAWGCGAFKETDDDAVIMATRFKHVCPKFPVPNIIFAVPGKKNYAVFVDVLVKT